MDGMVAVFTASWSGCRLTRSLTIQTTRIYPHWAGYILAPLWFAHKAILADSWYRSLCGLPCNISQSLQSDGLIIAQSLRWRPFVQYIAQSAPLSLWIDSSGLNNIHYRWTVRYWHSPHCSKKRMRIHRRDNYIWQSRIASFVPDAFLNGETVWTENVCIGTETGGAMLCQ